MRISDWSSDVCSSDLVGVVGCNGAETGCDEMRTARARGGDLLVYGDFGNAFFTLVGLEPGKEFAQCGAVLLHAAAHVVGLDGVLARLQQLRWINRLDFIGEGRSEERRGGKECVSRCRDRLDADH